MTVRWNIAEGMIIERYTRSEKIRDSPTGRMTLRTGARELRTGPELFIYIYNDERARTSHWLDPCAQLSVAGSQLS